MGASLADHLQQGSRSFEIRRVAAHQHRKGAGPGPFRAAGDRRIQVAHAPLRQRGGQLNAGVGAHGGAVDHQAARAKPLDGGLRVVQQHRP